MDTLLDLNQASAYVGLAPQTLRRLTRLQVVSFHRNGSRLVFEVSELDRLKAIEYPTGMSHTDIANRYGVLRTTVIYQFKRLRVQSLGRNRGGNFRNVYDPATVRKFARLLGWVEHKVDASDQDAHTAGV